MPREYDFITSYRLPPELVRKGYGELSRADFDRQNNLPAVADPTFPAHPLSCHIEADIRQQQALDVEKMFRWLEENATGNWFWDEKSMPGVAIHIDRISDQEDFEAAWGHVGEHTSHADYGIESEEYTLERLAIIYGVMPAQDPLENQPLSFGEALAYGKAGQWDIKEVFAFIGVKSEDEEGGIPEDFIAYLQGEIELNEVQRPYLERNYRPQLYSGADDNAPDEP